MNKAINIATWNVQFGNDLDNIVESIKDNNHFADLDFFMLQEASIHNGKEDASVIANIFGDDYTYFQVTAQTHKGIPQANAIIWNTQKITVHSFDVLEMPPFHPSSRLHKPYKKMIEKKHSLTFVLQTIFQKRISLVIEGQIHGYTFRIYVVHFDIIGLASKKRQMSFLLHDTNKRKRVDIEIIAGDINTFKYFKLPSWSAVMAQTQKEQFVDLTTHIRWTFKDKRMPKSFFAKHKLDAIFIRQSAFPVYSSWSLDVPGSDHIPVFARIRLLEKRQK